MPDQTRTLELYERQHDFVFSDLKNAAFIGGVGSGKTIAGVVRSLLASQGRIGGITIPTPNLGMITAPTYPMLRDATLRIFMEIAGDAVTDFHLSELRATMRGGSEIIFRNAEHPDRMRGPSISWWYGDEAAMYQQAVFDIMIGRLRQYGRRGYSWLTTTPRGRNWVWRKFVQDGREDYKIYRASTHDNPFLDEDYYQDLKASYSGQLAAQELAGEFVAFEGLVYEEFDRAVHIWDGPLPSMRSYLLGVDWGYSNPAVSLLIGLDGDGRAYIIDEFYRRRTRLADHIAATKAMIPPGILPPPVYCDPSEPEHIDEMKAAGLNAKKANNSILPGIQAVKARLAVQGDGKPRLYITPACPNVISEFESYIWAEQRGERLDKPEKMSDHTMDALRYALISLAKPAYEKARYVPFK